MNLRFLEKADGSKVLQYYNDDLIHAEEHNWFDVPTVKEPEKAREFWIEVNANSMEHRAFDECNSFGIGTIRFKGAKGPDMSRLIKVREILEDEKTSP